MTRRKNKKKEKKIKRNDCWKTTIMAEFKSTLQ